jgi:hypothetical protein
LEKENQFTSHDLCDKNCEKQAETKVQAPLEAVDNLPDVQKVIKLKLSKICGIDTFQMNASGTFQDHWFISCIYLTITFGCPIFCHLERMQK